ncbi:RagB/SusD family nutrient uptake outer membrane protein [Chitinophaga sp.]|uniref:RagB/SusD family nutrient uptake outer membrane protein n=1 Tax=Chitinophaga sp. TaxID=1869181 RepID=UPI002CD0572C|nr:RagB/SusD family nutrient uptake outer membrane protein [Chitinophaga sp.]HWV67636.1 RagB/SusD family nutrient uptake outer membrane protein [Chitinophaga sp.]
MLIAAVSLTSCKKLITIPSNPPSSVTQQQQFADSATAITAVAGVYAYNTGNGFAYTSGQLTTACGLSADELSYNNTDDVQQFFSYNLTPLNSGITTLWGYPYQGIYQVNAVLNGITGNANFSTAFRQQISGEMKVVRALYYFNMVNLFGGVPLVTSISYQETQRLPRSSAADIYKQVMADLTDASMKLTAGYPSAGRARPNLYTAIALLAKVNLYQGNWQSAYNEADSVIKSGLYNLTNTPLTGVFLEGSAEAIWQIPGNQGNYGVSDAQHFVPNYPGAIPNYILTASLLAAFETGDKRLQNWVGSSTVNGITIYYPYKYKNVVASSTPTEDQMILRLAEMYLIRAEAAAHLNHLTDALADVNIIRARAGLAASTADPASQAAVLNAVMHERQVEFFCEWANRWYDLKRTGRAETVLGAVKTGFSADAQLYPIPQAQIQLDNLLTQNPGY